MRNLYWQTKRFFWRINNVISWIPTIWSITWYDYDHIYRINRFALERMANHFENAKYKFVETASDIRYMRLCIKLIDRILDEYYHERAQEELTQLWGEYVFSNDDKFELRRELEKTEEDSKRYRQDFDRIKNYWRKKDEKARQLLFNILKNKLHRWWI